MNKNCIIVYTILCISLLAIDSKLIAQKLFDLSISSEKKVGQIEVGSPFVGIEVHNSFPMLNRISFYYPVANSIDISNDYWNRANYRIMSTGLKIDDTLKTILPIEVYRVEQTPYSVVFNKEKYKSGIEIRYEFCKDEPALIVTYKIRNISTYKKNYEVYTRLEAIIRTSHSYKLIDKAFTFYDKNTSSLRINYCSKEAGNSQLFIAQDGIDPSGFTSKSPINNNLDSLWLQMDYKLMNETISRRESEKPIAAFTYEKTLNPNEELKVIQIIGMLKSTEAEHRLKNIVLNYKKNIEEYKNYILENSRLNNSVITGDHNIDFTSQWSKAILSTNAHYIDGEIVPMPAQAEYNFYFTHDALLTDMAAVNFDIERVKKDLKFIVNHADVEKIIPHAYYWKDTAYKTEYAGTENWNHFWFTLVAARYLRHSNDLVFSKTIYPFVKKSIDTALKNKEDDNLMWSFRPDWWDIGNNYGPRAYMTILAIKALKEFCYFGMRLKINFNELQYYNTISEELNVNLEKKLWNDNLNYLTSFYQDGTEDRHIYMGSMLASHFNLLDEEKNKKLIETAKLYLLDEQLGVYTLFPMDLHKLNEYLGFAGNEAGEPYFYANGGIWPHGNAWYALGLINNRKHEEAYKFINKTMTLDGIMNSPNGQPAMYEYRISDKNNPEVYGKIDKPQFLWAGAWYLYTLYNLIGIQENEWNISINPYIPENLEKINLFLVINGVNVPITIQGESKYIKSIKFNDVEIPSAIIPADITVIKNIDVVLGKISHPYLTKANGIVENVNYDNEKKILKFQLSSLESSNINLEFISPFKCKKIICDGETLDFFSEQINEDGAYNITCTKKSINKSENYKIYINENNG